MTKMTNEQKAFELLECAKCAFRKQGNCCEKCFDKKAVLKMAKWKDEQHKLELDAKDEDVIQTDMDWKAVYDAEVVRHAKIEEALKAELDTLKSEHAKTQQQLAEYRQTLAELSKTNCKLVKDIAALSVCCYRCAKIGDTYKCGHNDNFGNPCDIDNCNILRANGR